MTARTTRKDVNAWRRCRVHRAWAARRHHPGGARKAAVTLLELLLGMVISSLVGAAVALMLFSTSYGTSSQAEMRNLLVSNQSIAERLDDALQVSQRVLAKDSHYLVLWKDDTVVNGTPDLSELWRIERDPSTDELRSYEAAADLAAEDDVEYDLDTTDFNAVTSALKDSVYFPGTLWATDVTAWSTTVNAADLRSANFVGYRITTSAEEVSETKIGGMKLRNH